VLASRINIILAYDVNKLFYDVSIVSDEIILIFPSTTNITNEIPCEPLPTHAESKLNSLRTGINDLTNAKLGNPEFIKILERQFLENHNTIHLYK
jgi:hypothetical protein